MNGFKKQPPNWVLTALAAGILGIFGWFVILPMQKAVGELNDQLEEQRAFVLQGERLRTELLLKEQELQTTHAFTELWSKHAADQGAISATLANVTSLAKRNQLAILRFEPNEIEHLESLHRSTVEMEIEGELQQIRSFLYELESMSAEVWATKIALRKASPTSNKIECDMQLTLFADNREFSD